MLPLGYELEFKGSSLSKMSKMYDIPLYRKDEKVPYDHFHLKNEIGISTIRQNEKEVNYFGGELISPIFTNWQTCEEETAYYLNILKEQRAYLLPNSYEAGFHIHLDKNFLDSWEKKQLLLKFLYTFQNEIFDLAKGRDEKIRDTFLFSTRPLKLKFVKKMLEQEKYVKLTDKLHCIRFTNDTVELRYFNSSLEKEVIESYLYFAINLRNFILDEQIDKERLDYYFHQTNDDRTFDLAKQNVMKKMLKL